MLVESRIGEPDYQKMLPVACMYFSQYHVHNFENV